MGLLDKLRRMSSGSEDDLTPEELHEFGDVVAQMTPFDFHVGKLCQITFMDRGSEDLTIYFGMLFILKSGLGGGFDKEHSAPELVMGKAKQNEDAADHIWHCSDIAESFGKEKVWQQLQIRAREGGIPRIVALTTLLVNLYEQTHPRPSARNLRGHYAALADYVFAVGLNMSILYPDKAEELANEPTKL